MTKAVIQGFSEVKSLDIDGRQGRHCRRYIVCTMMEIDCIPIGYWLLGGTYYTVLCSESLNCYVVDRLNHDWQSFRIVWHEHFSNYHRRDIKSKILIKIELSHFPSESTILLSQFILIRCVSMDELFLN